MEKTMANQTETVLMWGLYGDSMPAPDSLEGYYIYIYHYEDSTQGMLLVVQASS